MIFVFVSSVYWTQGDLHFDLNYISVLEDYCGTNKLLYFGATLHSKLSKAIFKRNFFKLFRPSPTVIGNFISIVNLSEMVS